MKKLLSLLTIAAVSSTASLTTISCGTTKSNSKKNINLDEGTVTKDLRDNLTTENPYDILRKIIATVASSQTETTVTASDIKNDTKITIAIIENGIKVADDAASKLGDGEDVTVSISVASGDKYFEASEWNKHLGVITKTTLDQNTVDLTKFGINIGTTYKEIYQNALFTIAKAGNIQVSDLNKIAVTLTSNNSTLSDDQLDSYVKYGDSIYVSYNAKGSQNFNDTNGWISSKAFQLKATLTNKTVNLNDDDITVGETTYSDIYNDERNDIANAANIDASEIASGDEANNVMVSLFVNGNYVGNDVKTTVSANDQLIAKYEVIGNSKHYNDIGWQQTDPINVSKASVTADNIQLTKIQVTYGASYDSIRQYEMTQIAQVANVAVSKIEADQTIHLSLYVDGTATTTQGTLQHGDSVYVTLAIGTGSKYFNEISTPIKSNAIQVDRITLDKSTVDLSSYDIKVGTDYSDIYSKTRTDIATKAGLQASDIEKGSEKNTVLLSLIVNGKAVVSGTIQTGDSVSMKYWVTSSSQHYNQVSLESNPINVKYTISNITLSIEKGNTESEIDSNIRNKIAKDAKINPSLIAPQTAEGQKIQIKVIDKNTEKEITAPLASGQTVYATVDITGSKYFEDYSKSTDPASIGKATLTNETVDLSDVTQGKTYADVYTEIRTQIANVAGIKASDIAKGGSEANSILVSLFVDGNWVSDSTSQKIAAGVGLVAKYYVSTSSQHYQATTGWLVTTSVSVDKVSIENQVNLTAVALGQSYSDIYQDVRTQIAKLAGIQASDIQSGSESSYVWLSLIVNGNAVVDGTIGYGDSVSMKYGVNDKSEHYNELKLCETKTVYASKADISNKTVTLSHDLVKEGTSYSDIYNAARIQIAAAAKISADDIKTGSEKDSVWLSLIVNGNAVVDGTIGYGDSVSMKYGATQDSKHYNATTTLESSEVTANKATVDTKTIDLNSEPITANKTMNSDVYSYVRNQIAKAGNISTDDIKTGSEKNSVLIAMYVNNIAAADDSSLLKPGDNITIKITITANSKHFMQTSFNTTREVSKVNISTTDINWKAFAITPKTTTYSQAYDYARTQIAKLAGIDADEIKSGDEANDVQLSLIVNSSAVVDGTFQYGDTVSMKYNITSSSKHFNSTNGWQETTTNNVAKYDLTTGNIKLNAADFTVNKSTYDDVRNNIRTQIANTVGIDASVIATGSEKDNVLISLIVNGNAVDNLPATTTLKPGDSFSVKYWTTTNSHYFKQTARTLETNTISFNKVDPSSIQISSLQVKLNEKDSQIWNDVYNLLATKSGLSISDIKNDSNIKITIMYGDDKDCLLQPLPNDDQSLIKTTANQLTINISIHNDQYFNDWDSQFVQIVPVDSL